jgi:hypothetical protein
MSILEKIDNLIEERRYYDDANDDPFYDPKPEPRYVPNNRITLDEEKRREEALGTIQRSVKGAMSTTASHDEEYIKNFLESLQSLVNIFAVGNQQHMDRLGVHVRRNYGYLESVNEARRAAPKLLKPSKPVKPKKVLTSKQENELTSNFNKLKRTLNQEMRGTNPDPDVRLNALLDATDSMVSIYRSALRKKSSKDW